MSSSETSRPAPSGERTGPDHGSGDEPGSGPDPSSESARWLVIDGRRWRRTDPALPAEVTEELTSELGRARSAVRSARAIGDDDALAAARHRVNTAKHGLGERGPYWWDRQESERVEDARQAVEQLRETPGSSANC